MDNNYIEYSKTLKVNLTLKDIKALLIRENVNLQLGSGKNLLIESVLINDLALINYLLDKSINIDFKDDLGNTATIWAAIKDHADALKILIKNKCDINLQNNDGFTALMWSTINGNCKCFDLLLGAGADIHIKSKWWLTALEYGKREIERGAITTECEYKNKNIKYLVGILNNK